jgi:hypothetical protein
VQKLCRLNRAQQGKLKQGKLSSKLDRSCVSTMGGEREKAQTDLSRVHVQDASWRRALAWDYRRRRLARCWWAPLLILASSQYHRPQKEGGARHLALDKLNNELRRFAKKSLALAYDVADEGHQSGA